jgi:hypothetical protein
VGVVLDGHLREEWALHVTDADGVEGDINAARLRRHRVGVTVDGFLLQRVDCRRLGRASAGPNLPQASVTHAHGLGEPAIVGDVAGPEGGESR